MTTNVLIKEEQKWLINSCLYKLGFPHGSDSKESACYSGDRRLTPRLEDPLEKELATGFSILACKSCGQRNLAGYSPKSRTQLRDSHKLPCSLCNQGNKYEIMRLSKEKRR